MTTEKELNDCYEAALKLIEDAGQIIASRNSERKTFVSKTGDSDLLTVTDEEVENLFKTKLSEKFPNHKFIGEEEFGVGIKSPLTDAPTWIIDPVDGTMNFVHGFPHSCISIALMVNKITEIGIIYNPVLNQKFITRRGHGSFYNGQRIYVSGEKDIKKALITSGFGTSKDEQKLNIVNENFLKLSKIVHGIRCLGAGALNMAMVAMGVADANYEMGTHIWDIAAADLLIREAGGIVIDTNGGDLDLMSRRVLAAATPELANEIAKHLTQYSPLPRDD
ncbi:inositol monophosphatase 1-like [Condylostylus longicornis]|uniref:inositol monophosphatase 1-like n=1 Tax=Condylostylus longicornis TaxID=2530218 RepID=UPI00244DB612|nr:inositol monophosphatase 1-like [Condylostylus longicornis]